MTWIWLCSLWLACGDTPSAASGPVSADNLGAPEAATGGAPTPAATPAPAKLGAGAVVWAEWTTGRWFHGTIAGPCDGGFQISYDDGSHACKPANLVQPDRTPTAAELTVGTTLLAQYLQEPERYQAQVTEITPEGYAILFSDGERAVNTLDQLRALPKGWTPTGSSAANGATRQGGLPSCHEVAIACKERSDQKSRDCWFACDGDEACRSACQSSNFDERRNCDNDPDRECERR